MYWGENNFLLVRTSLLQVTWYALIDEVSFAIGNNFFCNFFRQKLKLNFRKNISLCLCLHSCQMIRNLTQNKETSHSVRTCPNHQYPSTYFMLTNLQSLEICELPCHSLEVCGPTSLSPWSSTVEGDLRLVQTEPVIRSRIGRCNTCIKCGQLENSLSYCVLCSKLRRSEQTLRLISGQVVSCCVFDIPKNYSAHAWQHFTHVWLLGWSGCSSSTTKELHALSFPLTVP